MTSGVTGEAEAARGFVIAIASGIAAVATVIALLNSALERTGVTDDIGLLVDGVDITSLDPKRPFTVISRLASNMRVKIIAKTDLLQPRPRGMRRFCRNFGRFAINLLWKRKLRRIEEKTISLKRLNYQ